MAVTGGVNSFAAAASRQRFLPLSITIAKEKQDSSSSLKIQTQHHHHQHHRPTTSRPYLPPRAASTNKSTATSIIITTHKLNNTNINNSNERNTKKRNLAAVVSVSTKDDLDVLPVDSNGDSVDNVSASSSTGRAELEEDGSKAGVLVFESSGGGVAAGLSASSSPSPSSSLLEIEGEGFDRMIDRAINAAIVLAAGTFAITKLLTIDIDYWHGWTLYEILRYAPQHNWTAYEEALKTNPVLAKMFISGVVYSLGDWIAQCVEGKPLFDFDRTRMFRSGLVGFMLHGSLSHYYYYFCEALFPSKDWWVVPAKVAFDQTAWSAIWNSIYYVALGLLRFESPVSIYTELSSTFWPMLTAGWKLWPFAHLITYGVIPVEQRLLWVDCVELVWVTILSTYSNEKSEARHTEALSEE